MKKTMGFKLGAQILNRYLKTTAGKNAAWQGLTLPASPSESSSLSLNKHKHSQETQYPSLLLSDHPHQWSHYPHAGTKQNPVTHVTHLLSKSSHSEIISYLLTDWLIKSSKRTSILFFQVFFGFVFILINSVMQQGSPHDIFVPLCPDPANCKQFQGALLYIITAYHETIINTFLCRSENVNED